MITLTNAEIAALHAAAGTRSIMFRYAVADRFGAPKLVPDVASGSIALDSSKAVMRTGHFALRDDPRIDWHNDMLLVYLCVKANGRSFEWPLARFFMPIAPRTGSPKRYWREVEAFDASYALQEDEYVDRHRVLFGTPYLDAVRQTLSGLSAAPLLDECSLVLARDMEWDAGTPKLTVINDLLAAIAFEPLYADALGRFIARAYAPPSRRAPEYRYEPGALGVLSPDHTLDADAFARPNVFKALVSRAGGALEYTCEIDDPANPLSAHRRGGRRVLKVIRFDDCASADTLTAAAERARDEAAQALTRVRFDTLIMPHHCVGDVYTLAVEGETPAKYYETKWSMNLAPGELMSHTAQKTG